MDPTISELLKRSAAIPSMPQVAARFLEILQDPEFDYADVVEVLSADPGTASEILRLANSPLFGVARQITSLNQALTLLGLKRVRSLVLGRYIVDSIDRTHPQNIDITYYWRRSLTTAVLALSLAGRKGLEEREDAFIAGLLADVGVVILDEGLALRYRPIGSEYRPHGRADLAAMEEELLGFDHGQVSALVLEHWRLPAIICQAVRAHTRPMHDRSSPADMLAWLVGVADRVARYLCEPPHDPARAGQACTAILAEAEVDAAAAGELIAAAELPIAEFASMLRVDLSPGGPCAAIAAAIAGQPAAAAASA